MSKAQRLQAHRDLARQQPEKPDPWEIIVFRGWKMTRYTAAAIVVIEEELGYELTIVNGPYNDDVSASANTHNEDGVIDLAPFQAARKVRVMRGKHWVAFLRPFNWNSRGGGKHVHAVLSRPHDVNDLAEWQRDVAYPNGWNGLTGNHADNFPFHPEITPFNYHDWWHDGLLETRITGITARIQSLRERISALRAKRKLLRDQMND